MLRKRSLNRSNEYRVIDIPCASYNQIVTLVPILKETRDLITPDCFYGAASPEHLSSKGVARKE